MSMFVKELALIIQRLSVLRVDKKSRPMANQLCLFYFALQHEELIFANFKHWFARTFSSYWDVLATVEDQTSRNLLYNYIKDRMYKRHKYIP